MLYRSPPSDCIARASVLPLSVAPAGRKPGGGGGGLGWGSSGRTKGDGCPLPQVLNGIGDPVPISGLPDVALSCVSLSFGSASLNHCRTSGAAPAVVWLMGRHGLPPVGCAAQDTHAADILALAVPVLSYHLVVQISSLQCSFSAGLG
eukprot:6490280-Amphidinium_carterae.1